MFGVDALMQIPWLASIVGAVLWVGRTLWEFFGKAARTVAVWMAAFIPWCVAQAARSVAHRALIISIWIAAYSAVWLAVVNLLGMVISYTLPLQEWGLEGNIWLSWIWEEPVDLKFFMTTCFPIYLGALSVAYSIRHLMLIRYWLTKAGKATL